MRTVASGTTIASVAVPVTVGAYTAPGSQQQDPPTADPGPGSPQTGDTSNLELWAILGLSSAAMLAGLLLLDRRRMAREK